MPSSDTPAFRALSVSAGVQSSALLALPAHGLLPKGNYAVFADTGWEPRAVYAHLDRLDKQIAQPAGIPLLRVPAGNIRDDALDPRRRFASMPLYIRNQDGRPGMTRRQCTGEYKKKTRCPFHSNAQWRHIRDTSPQEWADVVASDAAVRQGNARANATGNQLLGQAFLHRPRLPPDEAPIDRVTAAEWASQQQPKAEAPGVEEREQGVVEGCSPWACRGGEPEPVRDDFGLAC